MEAVDIVSGAHFATLLDGELIRYCRTEEVTGLFKTITTDTTPFTLITHNSDKVLTSGVVNQRPTVIRHWFSSNNLSSAVNSVPLGIVNPHSPRGDLIVLQREMDTIRSRNDRVFVCWDDKTNAIRPKLKQILRGMKEVDIIERRLGYAEYLQYLHSYRYTISPPGAGPDCHRNWEALALGCIPIIPMRAMGSWGNALRSFECLSFWEDELTQGSLKAHLNLINCKELLVTSEKILSMRYWRELIRGEGSKKKVIAFSLWGNNPKYCQGMIENARLAKVVFPDWQVWVYRDNTVPDMVITELERQGCVLFYMGRNVGISGMFWRFLAAGYPNVEAVIFRDADSRLSLREKEMVDEWLVGNCKAHAIHDHPHHRALPLFGGMWGVRGSVFSQIATWVNDYPDKVKRPADMLFLQKVIWPLIKDSCCTHSSVLLPYSFKKIEPAPHYVGEIITVNAFNLPRYEPHSTTTMYNNEKARVRELAGNKGVFLNIGAADGFLGDSFAGLIEKGWPGICLEPDPDNFQKLMSNCKQFLQVQLINKAWAIQAGTILLYKNDNPRLSTTARDNTKGKGFNRELSIAAMTFADLPMETITHIHIDIEGLNLNCLQNIPLTICPVRLIVVEHQGENEEDFFKWFEVNDFVVRHRNRENLIATRDLNE